MEKILNEIKSITEATSNAVIGIDGFCASGKTTLADSIAKETGAQVIHMDDFFLPVDMRTDTRFSQPGGNIHYERFIQEVVQGIKNGKAFDYKVFNCKVCDYTETKTVYPDKPIIIEGAYAFHPAIPDIYDLKIFIKTEYNTQLKRILERNGADSLEIFKSKWIPLETQYFSTFSIEKYCDIVVET